MKRKNLPAFVLFVPALLLLIAALVISGFAPKQSEKDVYRIAWFSDPQGYSDYMPEIFDSMADWISKKADEGYIQYSICTGDFVNNYDRPEEWKNASASVKKIKSATALHVVAGNHDIDGSSQNYNAFLKNLGETVFKNSCTGGFYKKGVGRYDLIDVNGKPVLLLSMGYGMNDDAIAWMNGVLKKYSDRAAILCVHSYISPECEYTSDGNKLFLRVVKENPNIKLVLCGHRHGVAHKKSMLDDDGDGTPERTVYELIADYQEEPNCGGGYICLLSFDTAADTLSVKTYSPYLNDYNCYPDPSPREEFSVSLSLSAD